MQIIFTRNAILNLKAHFERIKENSGTPTARAFRKKIFDRTKLLQSFPRMGPKAEEFPQIPAEIRFLVEGKYKIYYQPTEETIFILRELENNR